MPRFELENNLRNNSRIVLIWLYLGGELEVFDHFDSLLLTPYVNVLTWLIISRANVIRYVFNSEFNDLVESLITQGIFLKIFNELAAFRFRIIRNFIQRIIKKENSFLTVASVLASFLTLTSRKLKIETSIVNSLVLFKKV